VGLKRGPFSLVRIIEELLGRISSSSVLDSRGYDRWGSVALITEHTLPAKVDISFAGRDGRSVGIVRLRADGRRV
jgi:hypothetical protein